MNDQPRTKLTQDIILRDYDEACSAIKRNRRNRWLILGVLLILGLRDPALLLVLLMMPILIVLFLFVRRLVVDEDDWDRKQMQKGNYKITEEAVTRKAEDNIADDDYYYIYFETIRILVDRRVSYPYRPSYEEVQIGDRYYIVDTPNDKVALVYPKKQWYADAVTEVTCVRETAERYRKDATEEAPVQEPLICRVMACEPYPKLTYRSKHYSEESKSYAQKIRNKPGQERDFLEELAAKQFYGDIMTALEYIVRYCPAVLWNEVEEALSDSQRELVPFVIAHVKAEEKEKKREKAKYAE